MGVLETSRDQETRQTAFRAAPVPGPKLGQGTREAMAEKGAWAAIAGPGTREAMVEQGAWAVIADPGTREAMVEQGA